MKVKRILRKLFPDKGMRAYRKMYRRHRRELVKHAKETHEWDWMWLHQSVIMQIRHMHEYYTEGNNVWQVDESRNKILEQLQHVLDLEAEIEKVDEAPGGYYEYIQNLKNLKSEMYKYIGEHIFEWWD